MYNENMKERVVEVKKKYDKKSMMLFFCVVIVLSVVIESAIIITGAMGAAVILMWVPAFGAILTKILYHRKDKAFLGFRICHVKYILGGILIPLIFTAGSYFIYWKMRPQSLLVEDMEELELFLLIGLPISLLSAIGEEIGWRGFMLPAFLERMGLCKALLLSSTIWGIWHLPLLMSGLYMAETPLWFRVPMFMLMIIPAGMIMGILTYKSESVWPAAFFHASQNHFNQSIFEPITFGDDRMFFISETGIYTVIILWIIVLIMFWKLKKS